MYSIPAVRPGGISRIKMLVIHYTADDFDVSLTALTGKDVSVHYLIPAVPPLVRGKPRIWQLVPESELAWHAGASFWRGQPVLTIPLSVLSWKTVAGRSRRDEVLHAV